MHTPRITLGYDTYGFPNKRRAYKTSSIEQDLEFSFNPYTQNLISRKDNITEKMDTYEYDNLDRLIRYNENTITYSPMGNILSKSDVGNYNYNTPDKPYAVSSIDIQNDSIATGLQNITYTSFRMPKSIEENGYQAKLLYDDEFSRVKTEITYGGKNALTRYYLGGCYEYDNLGTNSTIEKVYLFGDYYKSSMLYAKLNNKSKFCYNIVRDYLGSITSLVLNNGTGSIKMCYDPWGKLCDPTTLQPYGTGKEFLPLIGRGFTGHEHLTQFNLINMNGRLYDSTLGRFLSPDPNIQAYELSQNYNRYSYTLNNPLKYNDPNGEFIFTAFSAIVDFFCNIYKHKLHIGDYSWNRTINSFKLDIGMFKGNFGQIINKWTWGFMNTWIGRLLAEGFNLAGEIDNVTYLDGMAAVSRKSGNSTWACTIGYISVGPQGYVADWRDHLFVHEYGHYIQNQRFGPLFLPVIGYHSLMSALCTSKWLGIDHSERWFEMNASKLGAKHFDAKYGSGASGYVYKDPNYFDRYSFENNMDSPYTNPRYPDYEPRYPNMQKGWQGSTYPTSGAKAYL